MKVTNRFYDDSTKALLDLLYGYLEALGKDIEVPPYDFFEQVIGPIKANFLDEGYKLAEVYHKGVNDSHSIEEIDGACQMQIASIV